MRYLFSTLSVLCSICLLPKVMDAQYSGSGSVSQGIATTSNADIFPGCPGSRVSGVGSIVSTDGKTWVVPANTQFLSGNYLPDLYNQCSGITPANIGAVNLASIPTTVLDPSGSVITAYLFGDNYFELYINGILIGTDPVPYTPFNSCVVKFKVSYPYTIALKLVDWEENLGEGTELNGGNPNHAGDGGFIAYFSDGTVTDATWKAQTYYISPIEDLSTVVELPDSTRSTATANTNTSCGGSCYAVHYPVPSTWNTSGFNDSGWPNATLFTPATVGVSTINAYTNFPTIWSTAQFIWSSNLILDNELIVRKTVNGSLGIQDLDQLKKNIELYPNPTDGPFKLKLGSHLSLKDIQEIRILDNTGQTVFETKKAAEEFNLEKLPRGVYSVFLQFNGESLVKKLVLK